ncbi:MAG TPA: septum formation initiator [Stellaceae bacterium]|nr:septum formation initiator [Stellaceae bacterium]
MPNRSQVGWGCRVIVAAALTLNLFLAAPAEADDKPAPAVSFDLPARVETQHRIDLAGQALDYRAIAETIGLTNPKGEPTASVFTVSYLSDAPNKAARPVAFVFNGGPGAASAFLHLGALGPRVLDTPANGAPPQPPAGLVDNPATWLAFTDLVFVDPVGTGFSHGNGKDENPDKPFWNVRTDINELGAVLRRWLTRHQRWNAPVYLVGESYGGLRAAVLADNLERDIGLTVTGLVLISPALDLSLLHADITNPLAPAIALPSYAATAASLAGDPDAAEKALAAEHFALSDYLVGLAGLKGIPAKDDPFIAKVAATTGLPGEVARRERGRISAETFARELRRSQGEILSLYDATVARPTLPNPWDDHAGDAVLDPAVAAFTTAFATYAQEALGYRTERPYYVLSRQVSHQWNWDEAREGEDGLGLALSSLRKALLAHPATRLMIANGRYDLVTPYLGSRWLIDQLAVPAAVRDAIVLRVYEGGHMMYLRPASRAALATDAASLFASPAAAPAR